MRITIYFLLLEKNHGAFKHCLWLTAPNTRECCVIAPRSPAAAFIPHTVCAVSSQDFTVNLTVCLNSYLNVKDFDIFLKRIMESTPKGSYEDKTINSKLKQIHHFKPSAGTHTETNAHRSLFPVWSPKAIETCGLDVQPRCSAPAGEHSRHCEHHFFSGQ